MFLKRLQLALIHTAVAMTLVPLTGTLNRVMIFDFGISKTIFTLIAIFPYLFSPIQVAIGSYADRHPILGYRRTPHILLGLLLCAAGLGISSSMVSIIQDNFTLGILIGLFAFFLWGMGYHFSAVSYFSLASEISGEKGRGTTIATMFFMMVLGIIAASQTVAYLATRSPVSDPFVRFGQAEKMGREEMIQNSRIYFNPWETIHEGNPQEILDRGEVVTLPPLLIMQGELDDNVLPSAQEKFAASYRAAGGDCELEIFAGCEHRWVAEPGPQTDRAAEMVKDFIARQLSTFRRAA